MIIELNDKEPLTRDNNTEHLKGDYNQFLKYRIESSNNVTCLISDNIPDNAIKFTQSYLEYVSWCYSRHLKMKLNPHDLWYMVLTEITKIIAKSPTTFNSLFTTSDSKSTIMIPTHDVTRLDINFVEDALKKLVPVDIDTYIPGFSTHTVQSRLATLASFCDAMSQYYNYMTYCCGIPAIKVTGTHDDWLMFETNLTTIKNQFNSVGVTEYDSWFNTVLYRISLISDSLVGGDTSFYRDIFTQRNIGSGGQLIISGWITEFYHTQPESKRLDLYPDAISVVPYTNLETSRTFKEFHGCFFIVEENGWHDTYYGKIVTEDNPK